MQTFAGARLVLFKGDANYRAYLGGPALADGDAVGAGQPAISPPRCCCCAPARAIRSSACPLVLADTLDSEDDQWRVNGRRGVIQGIDPQSSSK